MKYVFGPVASRRLGVSLGVDLLYNNICSFNCVYCECGKTENLTTEIKEYVNTDEVISELKKILEEKSKNIDFVTFSGSGEPTLHKHIKKIIDFIKQYDVNVALLTNSTMLNRKEVRENIEKVDLIVPTLNTVHQSTLQKINIPSKDVNIDDIKDGLFKLGNEFKGKIFVEILFCKGINDSQKEIEDLADYLNTIKFNKVQINTVVRPPAFSIAQSLDFDELKRINEFFISKGIDSEIIGKPVNIKADDFDKERFLRAISIRPMTIEDIKSLFKDQDIEKRINEMIKKRVLFKEEGFYYIKK